MSNEYQNQNLINEILTSAKVIAVVGMSANQARDSYNVGMYLKDADYTIIPVNPVYPEIDGIKSYPSITDIPEDIKVDVVDVFRKPEDVLPIVEETIKRGVKYLWLQKQVVNPEAAQLAQKSGIKVIMDKCMLEEHKHM